MVQTSNQERPYSKPHQGCALFSLHSQGKEKEAQNPIRPLGVLLAQAPYNTPCTYMRTYYIFPTLANLDTSGGMRKCRAGDVSLCADARKA
jgi:hypothetical protein